MQTKCEFAFQELQSRAGGKSFIGRAVVDRIVYADKPKAVVVSMEARRHEPTVYIREIADLNGGHTATLLAEGPLEAISLTARNGLERPCDEAWFTNLTAGSVIYFRANIEQSNPGRFTLIGVTDIDEENHTFDGDFLLEIECWQSAFQALCDSLPEETRYLVLDKIERMSNKHGCGEDGGPISLMHAIAAVFPNSGYHWKTT